MHDTNENPIAVVIDDAAAKRYWPPGKSALGEFARLGGPSGSRVQVVGVVGTVKNEGLNKTPRPELYLLKDLVAVNPMQFAVRSTVPETSLAPTIRRAIATVDPAQPIYSISSLREIFGESLTFQRIESIVVTVFALAALL